MPTTAPHMQLSSLYQIDPLTGDNYSAWKENMHWILLEQDLWEHISWQAVKPLKKKSDCRLDEEGSTGNCGHQSLN